MSQDLQAENERRERLRQRAEEILRQHPQNREAVIPPNVRRLLHELQIHQIELEMQNEELRGAHKELAAGRDRLADLYHLAPVGYVIIDEHGAIQRANYTALGMLRTEANLAGRELARFVHAEDAEVFYHHRRAAFEESVIQTCELRLKQENGDVFHARLDTIAGEHDGEKYARVAITDVTERVRAELAVAEIAREAQRTLEAQVEERSAALAQALEREREARAEADRANAFKTQLLGMISHELRTPLTSIVGFTSTLLAEDVNWDADSQTDFLRTILTESEKLKELVDQLLQASRIEAGQLDVSPEPVSLSTIMTVARTQLETLTVQHNLIIEVPEDLPELLADVRRVAQVLTNLVKNAALHSPPDSAIVIASREEDGVVQVDVIDQGEGIPAEAREHIFEAFWRPEREAQIGGAGLGLTICHSIVKAHGGEIWIQDNPPPGTTVSFTLPLAEGE